MKKTIPKKLLRTKFRRIMWAQSKRIINKLEKLLPIEESYLMGSFSTRKSSPADVDFMIVLKVPENQAKIKWAVDMVIVPNNKYGEIVLNDAERWVKKKYNLKNYSMLRLK